ncbi:1-hydroxycarotenoid 3,4-desaturase CrtD [Pseudorhodoplanes sp.]|uniref:1-hydroxycarotenoid 3,4-desaturase CrtD n=1 Tax=Pseudorhodoplanes sp. TaxID=1934341 RepID=UPI0039190D98
MDRVAVIGAGIGGLAAALDLASRGLEVSVYERGAAPGGKMRPAQFGDVTVDAGPTVFTMRSVFESLFADAGEAFSDHVALRPLTILARHAWSETERLDLCADIAASADRIGAFAGAAEARRFLDFCARARQIFQTLDRSFMQAQRPSPIGLVTASGAAGLPQLMKISPFTTLWHELGKYFHDPRLRQLFGRYATYCGSSPFEAPATLMLIAHAEQDGVWSVDGGMHRLAQAIVALAERHGVRFHYNSGVRDITVAHGRVSGLTLETDQWAAADAVVFNGDAAAIGDGFLGAAVTHAVPQIERRHRSLSAVTWTAVAQAQGFALTRHNVFFSRDYRAEFDDIFTRARLPQGPTVYVCAQDRIDDEPHHGGPERLLVLVNAPPTGDRTGDLEIASCRDRTFEHLQRCGLTISMQPEMSRLTTPRDFDWDYPATGGALYGQASHGWMASFRRPGSRSKIPGLYLAGGSVHPGAGVPMAALSGRLAARALMEDRASTPRWRPMAMPGGMSMA